MSTSEIAKLFSTSSTTIKNRLNKMGVNLKNKIYPSNLNNDEIKRLYLEENMSTHEIAELFNVSANTINDRLKKKWESRLKTEDFVIILLMKTLLN